MDAPREAENYISPQPVGGRSKVVFQPKGVVGVMAPWNFPVNLLFLPLSGVLAAGNRAILKPSEFTPRASELVKKMVSEFFSDDELFVVTGDASVGADFSQQPFDHLVFTGATSIGKHVMAAAAKNLVPVTLELGGKSPVILSRDIDLEKSLRRILLGKTLNAGQICIAPDYLLLPKELVESSVGLIEKIVTEMYPTIAANPDYTSIISDRHYARLKALIDDAARNGATVKVVNPTNETLEGSREHNKIALTIITNPSDSMEIMNDEIFGPILPLVPYDTFDDAVSYINNRPRPLALYYFGNSKDESRKVIENTTSGEYASMMFFLMSCKKIYHLEGLGPQEWVITMALMVLKSSHIKKQYIDRPPLISMDCLAYVLHLARSLKRPLKCS
ncbi:aldehyde dehydrogenase family protein [Kineobactrum salinum]|uniref:aldehyde dehydrogenase family protein n=1 Tax=Kineobactrum salinum TaxID=2708301 RepID=UPI001E314E87|nr:aldehyde dehydrogenase family protein [Kineobactrum salinum]